MSVHSIAQTLPEDVLELVIWHATGAKRLKGLQTLDYAPTYSRDIMPFLGVCSHWRSVALSVFYMHFALKTNKDVTLIESPQGFLHGIDDIIACNLEKTASCAEVEVPLEGIVKGNLAGLLSTAPYVNTEFPSVTNLSVRIENDSKLEVEATEEHRNNVNLFCEHIGRLFPNVYLLRFNSSSIWTPSTACGDLLSDLVAGLTKGVRALEFIGDGYLHLDDLSHLTNLLRLTIHTEHRDSNMAELIRRNASTLEHIDIKTSEVGGTTGFVQDPEGNTMIYPRLKKLTIFTRDYSLAGERVSPKGTPFPVLTHLSLKGVYPFGNDILFRGSNETLESLDMVLENQLQQIILRSGTFGQYRHSRLHRISIDLAFFDIAPGIVQLLFEIGPNVQAVKANLGDYESSSTLLDAVRNSRAKSQIQCLTIKSLNLLATEIVELIELLPNLKHLKVKLADEENTQDATAAPSNSFATLQGRQEPISNRLHSIHFKVDMWPPSRLAVRNIQIIASLIPSLRYVVVQELASEEWQELFKEVTTEPTFAPRTAHLRSLTYLDGLYREAKRLPM
ncbi:hypothetical protein GQ54DRAFT_298042 [Martensiomyces pterosporus]|nr:hypothetical protein GQ54DRAFT_298042 [Martensiomyces pterosporus]